VSPASASVKVPAGSTREKAEPTTAFLAAGLDRKRWRVVGTMNAEP